MIYHLLENYWNVVHHINFNSQAGIFSIIMTNAAKGVSVAISPQMSHSLYNFLKFV